MPRFRAAALLAAIVSLAVAGTAVASAAKTHVTGGTTTITPSSAAATVLSNNHITVTPVAPATAASGAFTFPITGGRLNTTNLHGVLRHSGGIQVSNGTKTVTLRRLTIVSTKRAASIYALVRGPSARMCRHLGRHHARLHCVVVTRLRSARIATIASGSVTGGTFNGTVDITKWTADAIDKLAGSAVVSAGSPLGTIAITPTLA